MRALWFVVVGWWLTAIVSILAWFAMVTIIGLPLGIYLVNHVPTYLTLRPRTKTTYWVADPAGGAMTIGHLLIVLILTIPVGLWMYNRVPFVASLYRY